MSTMKNIARCECGEVIEQRKSIFVRSANGAPVSRYVCADCHRRWLRSMMPTAQPALVEADGPLFTFTEG